MKHRIAMILAIFTVLCGGFVSYKLMERKVISDIFSDVMERYQEAYRIIYGLDVKCDDNEIEDGNGYSYFILQEENYINVEDIRNLMESTFSQRYINDCMYWVIGTKNALYKEIEGVLCRAHADAIGLGIPTEICSIERKHNNIVLIATNGERQYQLILLKQNGKWLIDDIVLKTLKEGV